MKKFTFLSAFLLCTVWLAYGQWTYTDLSSPKKLMGVATLGSKAYFAGGHNGSTALALVESYDVETGTWANIDNLSVARQAPSGVTCGSKLFFGGGVSANFNTVYSTVDIYDTVTGTWTVAQLSVARFDISAFSYGNKVFFAGGCNYNIVCTDVVDIYDALTGTWTISSLSVARAGMACAVSGDLAVLAGGFLNGGSVSDQVDIYNFTTNTWTTATLSEARVWASAVIVGDKVIIAGGMKYFPDVPSNRVDIFDASTGTWSTATLFEPRSWLSAGAVNGKAYFAGGSNVANGGVPYDFSNIVDVYNEADNSWSVDVLATPRQSQGLAIGDYFLVAGGVCASGLLSSVEILNVPYVPHIIHVPGDYPTIQQGIDAAQDNDTVLVADSTYYENINFIGKSILVASEYLLDGDTNHIVNTIIDGSEPVNPDIGSVVTFTSGEDTTSVLCGFTITGGTGTIVTAAGAKAGGGVFIQYSGAKLINNYIEYNQAKYTGWSIGGGVCAGGPITPLPWVVLRGNRINHNQAENTVDDTGAGGGIICFYNLILENNEISYNEANGYLGGDGGGMECMGSFGPIELKINHNFILYNEANANVGSSNYAGLGGGICLAFNCWGTIRDNVISFNSIEAPNTFISWGPGVFIQDITSNDFIFENNIVEENNTNSDNSRGGGLSLLRAGGIYQNNVFQNNYAYRGGGISIGYTNEVSDTAILINNTITENEASFGGGIHVQSSKSVIVNSIVWGNEAANEPSIYQTGSTLEVRYSDVEGADVWPGQGNVNCSPSFLSDGYHLDPACQLMNAGVTSIQINEVWYDCPEYDIDGEIRPWANTQPEIGVDEVADVSIGEPVSTNSLSINVYPNPADQMVTISIRNGATFNEVSIYNQTGQNVYRGIPDDNTIDVSELQPGVYLIEVRCNQQKFREKLIIK